MMRDLWTEIGKFHDVWFAGLGHGRREMTVLMVEGEVEIIVTWFMRVRDVPHTLVRETWGRHLCGFGGEVEGREIVAWMRAKARDLAASQGVKGD